MAAWVEEDSVGITGLYGPVVDELLQTNERNHGWDREQYLSEGLIASFEESERMTSEECRKVFARRERVLGDSVGPGGYCLHSACLAEGLQVQGVVAPNTLYFPFVAENCLVSQCHVLK